MKQSSLSTPGKLFPSFSFDNPFTLAVLSDHPLALYVFSSVAAFKNKGVSYICSGTSKVTKFVLVFDNTQSGSCVANECVIIAGADGLPFGGTGGSGRTWSSVHRPCQALAHPPAC